MRAPAHLSTAWAVLAPTIGDHLWQSTVFALIAGLLTLALRKNQARFRYGLWLAASIKFLIPFSLLVGVGRHLAVSHRPVEVQPGFSFAMQTAQLFTPASIPAVVPAATTGHPSLVPWFPLFLAAVWFSGFVLVLSVWTRGWQQIAAVMRSAAPLYEGREWQTLRRLQERADARSRLGLWLSSSCLEPGIFGIFRPVLIWPKGLSRRFDDAHLEAVLAHELCHARRRDNLAAAVHTMVEALFWFHPLVWWMETRLVEERERACDEEVLRICEQPGVYAESILKVCEFCVAPPPACVSGITGADLKKRVARIMTGGVGRGLGLRGRVMLVLASCIAIAAPVMSGLVRGTNALAQPAWVDKPLQAQAATEREQLMAADANPGFLVATIKASDPNSPRQGWSFESEGHHITCFNATLDDIVRMAYGIHPKQVVGAPEWFNKDRFDISGIPDLPGVPNLKQVQHMYRELLADRFHMVIHRETREMPVYAITVAEGGPSFKVADPNENTNAGNSGGGGQRTMRFTNMSMPDFALNLSFYEDRPVIDETSLPGRYDFTLRWTYDLDRAGDADTPPSIFTAMKEQLGLKLEATKGPAEVLVIDHVEKPSPN